MDRCNDHLLIELQWFSFFYLLFRPRPSSTLFPYTTLFRSWMERIEAGLPPLILGDGRQTMDFVFTEASTLARAMSDRKSTRLNSSHPSISYAVFCLKKKNYLPPCIHLGS